MAYYILLPLQLQPMSKVNLRDTKAKQPQVTFPPPSPSHFGQKAVDKAS